MPPGERRSFNVSASQGPAVTRAHSAAAGSASSPATAAPDNRRMASAKVRPLRSARSCAALNWLRARSSRSRSISTQTPRSNARPSVPASSVAISLSSSGSPFSVTSMLKSSRPSRPIAEGVRAPTVAVTCGRAGRLVRQVAGMRRTTPAPSSSGALFKNRAASATVQRRG